MKGTPATRIAILVLVVLLAIAGILVFAWPTFQSERTAPVALSGAPGPAASSGPSAPKPAAPPPAAPVKAAVDALKDITKEVGPKPDRAADRAPSFDVARIEPNGETVIGGRAAPGATIELLRGGVTHARTTADPSGDFVLVPTPLPPGNYDLTLRATDKDGKISTSKDSVAVVLRPGSKDKPVVALAEPDKPTVVLSKPTVDPAAATGLAIDAVEGEAGGKMYVSGRAPPGAKVNLYLNDAYIASATASAESRIAFSIRSGIRPGDYRVRLDQVDDSGNVQKRAEVPFTAPVTVAAASPATPKPGPGDTANRMAAAGSEPSPSPPPAAAAAPPTPPEPAAPQTPPPPRDTASMPAGQPPSSSLAAAPPATPPQPAAAPQTASAPRDTASTPAGAPPSPATSETAASQPAKDAAPPPAHSPTMTATATPKPTATQDAGTGVVVIPRVDTTVVNRGDSLWRISRTTYGRGIRYSVIYNANRDQIRNPDLIYPGQIFVLPKNKQ